MKFSKMQTLIKTTYKPFVEKQVFDGWHPKDSEHWKKFYEENKRPGVTKKMIQHAYILAEKNVDQMREKELKDIKERLILLEELCEK